MKVGDVFNVDLEGMAVAEARLESIEDGQATLVIPATRFVIQIKQTLDVGATKTPEVDRVFGGLSEGTGETLSPAAQEQIVASPQAGTATPVAAVGEGIHNAVLDSSAID